MKALQPIDSLHLRVAQGWCDLHAFAEADAELDQIAASFRDHPKVLEVRWQIYANLEKWDGALEIASAIVKAVPEWPSGWIYRASSLTELNRQQEAYETLHLDFLYRRSFDAPLGLAKAMKRCPYCGKQYGMSKRIRE